MRPYTSHQLEIKFWDGHIVKFSMLTLKESELYYDTED